MDRKSQDTSHNIFFDLEKPLGQKVTGQKVTIHIYNVFDLEKPLGQNVTGQKVTIHILA
jgi:hypothetical protein